MGISHETINIITASHQCQPMLFFCSNHNRHVWSQSRLSKNDFARSYFQIENPLDKKNWRLGAKITFCALLKDSWRKLCLLGRVVFPISRLNQKSNVLRPPEKYVFALLRYNLLHLFFCQTSSCQLLFLRLSSLISFKLLFPAQQTSWNANCEYKCRNHSNSKWNYFYVQFCFC